jgi:hypothetical protein
MPLNSAAKIRRKVRAWAGFGAALLALVAILGLPGATQAQNDPTATPPPTVSTTPPVSPPAQTAQPADGATSDYLSESLRLLFPAAPASLDWNGLQEPIFTSDTPGFDMVSLGILKFGDSTPLTKTFTLNLGGGVRGRLFATPPWLSPVPDRFVNPGGNGQLNVSLNLRQDPGQGAGLLPAQTNWGHMLLSLNGVMFDYAVPLIAEGPPAIKTEDGDRVFALQKEIADRLDSQGDLDAFIGSPRYPNAAQVALGLAVDYLGEPEYNRRLARTDFTGRVAEMLSQKDYNHDGWIGFRPEDILLGAPGWALGQPAPNNNK